MLTIAGLDLRNWKCFAGEHRLELRPIGYAIVARDKADGDRSNWLGKSSLLQAVDYALNGRLPPDCRRKQDWITEGEKSGEIAIVLSDGTRIVRSLARTTSERLWYFPPGAGKEQAAVQASAQQAIDRLRGLTEADDLATWYFQQGQMARLVKCEAAARMELVVGWMRLEPVQACEADASAILSQVCVRRDALLEQKRRAEEQAVALLGRFADWTKAAEEMNERIDHASVVVRGAKERLDGLAASLQRNREREQLRAQASRYEAIVAEGKRLAAEMAGLSRADLELLSNTAQQNVRTVSARMGIANNELAGRRSIQRAGFDGTCPIVGRQCPANAFVQASKAEQEELFAKAQRAAQDARAAYEEQTAEQARAAQALMAFDRNEVRIRDLRTEARALKVAHERYLELARAPADESDVSLAYVDATQAYERVVQEMGGLQADARTLARAAEEWANCQAMLVQAERDVRTAGAAMQVFGKNGAQRRIAEGMLSDVEARACELFEECGIDLSVKIVWSRDGAGLAKACHACGEAYPASERVKECRRCGTARGPNLVNRLEVEGSSRSGAADDLVGAFVQLAASEWLREDRASEWGVCALDEPFGQMDAANRRSFAQHLPEVLRRVGFDQQLVIAHHASVLDAMPGRILVEGSAGRSTVRVVG